VWPLNPVALTQCVAVPMGKAHPVPPCASGDPGRPGAWSRILAPRPVRQGNLNYRNEPWYHGQHPGAVPCVAAYEAATATQFEPGLVSSEMCTRSASAFALQKSAVLTLSRLLMVPTIFSARAGSVRAATRATLTMSAGSW